MPVRLKPVGEQVIVLTGASSGIGLATARRAASRGARLVLVARNERALQELARECKELGGHAIAAPADVAREGDLERVAQAAKNTFGGFDTWVNNAGGSIYGRVTDVPTEDFRRLFETNFWGVVNGSRIAVEHFREKGGALINVGSVASDVPIPMQGAYSASKHAVEGFTDSLRIELLKEKAPISVTLIKPSGIDTPFAEHAASRMDGEAQIPPPLY